MSPPESVMLTTRFEGSRPINTGNILTLSLAEEKFNKLTRVDHLWPNGKSPRIDCLIDQALIA